MSFSSRTARAFRRMLALLFTLSLTLPAAAQTLPKALKPVPKSTKASPTSPPAVAPKAPTTSPPTTSAPAQPPTPPPGFAPGAAPTQPGAPPGFAPGATPTQPGAPPAFPPGATPNQPGAPPGFAPGATPTQPGAPPGFAPGAPGQTPGAPPGFPAGAAARLPPGAIPIPVPIPVPIDASYGPNISFEEAVAALKSGDNSFKNLYWPLRVLDKLPVDAKRREEVAALIDPLLVSDNYSLRRAANDAIAGWGTQKNIPTLLKLLEYQEGAERGRAMEALGAIGGSKEAARAVAARLLVSADQYEAKKSLSKMGAYAEEVIWQYVGSSEDSVHRAACQVLGDVGTTKSLLKLRALRRDPDSYRQLQYENAQKEMQKRLVKR